MSAIGLSLERGRGRARRWLDVAALVLSLASGALLAVVVAGLAIGLRPLVDRSDSMAPAIRAGDVVVVRMVEPARVARGDVVTFRDPSRQGDLVTHRVVRMRREGGAYAFVTRGDANTGVERWAIPVDGRLGRLALRVPNAGYAVAWLGVPTVRLAVVTGTSVLLGVAVLRRIWRR
ncbi:MAG: signal peptidase I [Actinomycetota bacterium]